MERAEPDMATVIGVGSRHLALPHYGAADERDRRRHVAISVFSVLGFGSSIERKNVDNRRSFPIRLTQPDPPCIVQACDLDHTAPNRHAFAQRPRFAAKSSLRSRLRILASGFR